MRIQTLARLPLAATLGLLLAQTKVDLKLQSKSVDFSSASSTKPMRTGTSIPTGCAQGEMFLLLNAAAGRSVYACTSTGVWQLQAPTAETPAISGATNGRILSNDGTQATWNAPNGDLTGTVNQLRVEGIQGRSVSASSPVDGDALRWNSATSKWEPAPAGDASVAAGDGIAIVGGVVAVGTPLCPST
jgi:hypothetical protein